MINIYSDFSSNFVIKKLWEPFPRFTLTLRAGLSDQDTKDTNENMDFKLSRGSNSLGFEKNPIEDVVARMQKWGGIFIN